VNLEADISKFVLQTAIFSTKAMILNPSKRSYLTSRGFSRLSGKKASQSTTLVKVIVLICPLFLPGKPLAQKTMQREKELGIRDHLVGSSSVVKMVTISSQSCIPCLMRI
jgi:hypothetical protein